MMQILDELRPHGCCSEEICDPRTCLTNTKAMLNIPGLDISDIAKFRESQRTAEALIANNQRYPDRLPIDEISL